jgi:AcrR family transcriptional regulator
MLEPETRSQPALRADARRNRLALVEAARELFTERGTAVEMREIAERAGVGVGTLYRHFPDRAELVEALLEDKFAQLARRFEAQLERDRTPWERLEGAIRDACEINQRDLGVAEVLSAGSAAHQTIARATPGLVDSLDRIVREAVREGSARRDLEWEDVVMCLCGISQTIVQQEHLPGRWERLLEIQLDGLRRHP